MSQLLTAIDDAGKAVDWWFAYKVAAKSDAARTSQGNDYLYFDANGAKTKSKPAMSPCKIDAAQGALFHTLQQIYAEGAAKKPGLGWYCYNDQNPDEKTGYKNPVNNAAFKPGTSVGARGHTKGVLAFDMESNSGFWLIHSTPRFIIPEHFQFPATGLKNAQSFLCISLPDAATAQKLAQQMYHCQQPNVYGASPLPKSLEGSKTDFRVLMMNDQVDSPATKDDNVLKAVIPFRSRGGQKFQAIAKNKIWGQTDHPKLNFYNDLVSVVLNEDLDVETWEHDPTPPPTDRYSRHKVVDMKSVDLKPLGFDFAWSEEQDHAKLALSDPDEKVHYVCVGGMNFTLAQENRGGATVAFLCEPLWKALNAILSTSRKSAPGPASKTAGKNK
jgi:deoxyribonuclease-2